MAGNCLRASSVDDHSEGALSADITSDSSIHPFPVPANRSIERCLFLRSGPELHA